MFATWKSEEAEAKSHPSRPEVVDIEWLGSLTEALHEATRLRRPVVVKPAGQGFDADDNW